MIKIFSIELIKILIAIFIIVFLFSFSPQKPESISATIPFGGQIIGQIPSCNYFTSSLIFLKIPPAALPPKVMYEFGISYSFLWGPPKQPSQYLLGSSSAPLGCVVGKCPACTLVGGGPVILFHGSSV